VRTYADIIIIASLSCFKLRQVSLAMEERVKTLIRIVVRRPGLDSQQGQKFFALSPHPDLFETDTVLYRMGTEG
jgi:hypothetical protein